MPVTEATRGPADEPRARTASGAGARAGSLRSAASTELQASFDGFHDWRTRGVDFTQNRTNGADASVRLVGRGTLAMERARLTGNGAT